MISNFNTWLAYFPYEKPTDSDPLKVITPSANPLQQAQLFSHEKYPGHNILMVPPGGSAYLYNSYNPDDSIAFQVKNVLSPIGETNETIVRPGHLKHSPDGLNRPLDFFPLRSPTEDILYTLKMLPEDLEAKKRIKQENQGQIFFKNGLVRILHGILPTKFLGVGDNFITNAITEPINELPITLDVKAL